MEAAIALSQVSLPLLAEVVRLRLTASGLDRTATCVAFPVERTASLPDSPRHVGQSRADWPSFCQALVATAGRFSSTGGPTFWYPIVGHPLDDNARCETDFSGVDVLRAVALARLVLPRQIQVLAPLATLGPKLAQVALEFGASHLGYVAPDGQPPADPLFAESSVFDELLASVSRTEVK